VHIKISVSVLGSGLIIKIWWLWVYV